jgi:hypothetical protein
MASFVDATHNMLFRLADAPAKWVQDLRKSSQGDITGYQEAEGHPARSTLTKFCDANNRGLFIPEDCGNPISWDLTMFNAIRGEAGVVEVHKKHPTAKYNPARDIAWRGLRHLSTGKKVLRINIHPVASATKPDAKSDWGKNLTQWKDWALGNYFLDLVAFTATQMSREYYDAILLGGDYNAYLDRDERWYYPGALLPALYHDDQRMRGLDHLQSTYESDVKEGRRWAVKGNTDHSIHFLTRTFVNVPDFPGQ